ncbi:MAG TPA: DUF2852 domain-containing protein [Stellaceae bacterium]|nr:DUF2852 domain-containing protein [Stellaceae bacterium]
MSTLIERVDDYGRPAWIALMVLSFILCWPIGLIILGFLIGSGRMSCWYHGYGGNGNGWRGDRWQRKVDRMQRGVDRMQDGLNRMQAAAEQFRSYFQQNRDSRSDYRAAGTSGNRAFDDYRAETLRRLEEEEREFREFLDRLRQAKDKAEFDQFMAERRGMRDVTPPPQA